MYNVQSPSCRQMSVEINIDEKPVRMEVDTGATLSIMSHNTYLETEETAPPIESNNAKLSTYTGQRIAVVGTVDVNAEYHGQTARAELVIVDGDGPTLLGRDWLRHFRLDWVKLHKINSQHSSKLEELLSKHANHFEPGLGKIVETTAKLYLKKEARPKFCRARLVPYALREIDRQVEQGILEPVKFSKWATPVVPILKKDGSIRFCGDYKITVEPTPQTPKVTRYPK